MTHQETFLAKITRPNPHNVYLREKFFSILDKCREKPVIWLSAPPGAGKTTLISSYIESRKVQCLWYQVDSGDRYPATFFHYMGSAAKKFNPRKRKPLPHLTPEYRFGIQAFTREYFSELYKRLGSESLIIFDNYQEVPAGSVFHEMIYEGLANIPEGMNIIIISRTAPPPILSRMRLSQLMEVITWDELRLTTEEVKGIVSNRGMKTATDEEARNLLVRTDGWVAGLVLMSECGRTADFYSGSMDSSSEEVFNYFADKFFQKLNDGTRDFLLKSSVLSTMTSGMAEELTGNKQAAGIISELVHKNYFIQSHVSDQVRHQYHPLFREFLLARLRKESNLDNLADIERRAAKLLADNGHADDAVRLFFKNGDWGALVPLICKEAPAMLKQGRHQTLEDWLTCLPEHVMDSAPWLLFWKGSCHLPFDQCKSRLFFERAFEALYNKKDPCGIFLSWCGIVDATIHEFDNFKTLDRWIDLLKDLLREYPSFPSKEIEGRVSMCMFTALSFRAPQHPDINLWVDKTYAFLYEISDPDIIARISLGLVDYFVWIGDLEKANVIVENLSKAVRHNNGSPMALISIRLAESLNNWHRGELRPCIAAVSEGLKTADAKGVNVFNYFLYGHGAIASLTGGDLEAAEEYLKKAASVLDDNKGFCASYYQHIAACFWLLKRDLPGALEHERLALSLTVKAGSPFAEAMSRTGMALLHYELGERQEAVREIGNAYELALKTGSRLVEFVCYLFEAYFALDSDATRDLAVERLKKAMSLGCRHGFVNFHMWRTDIMAHLCVLALKEGIEAEYVKRLIRKRDLFPDVSPLEVCDWPWRLKIYVLRQFTVIKDGVSLQFSKKVPRKPIDMLKLIISLGGKDVPEDKISDTLWQDADGDAAHVAFTTTLKRLRYLLGVDDAILLRNGCLTLNPHHCWVDALAFDHLISRAEALSGDGMDDVSAGLLESAVELYGTGFNINFDEDNWAILFYERIRSKFIRSVIKLGSYWEKAGRSEKAIEWYRKGIEIDLLSEELYQKLMVCLHRHGHKAEALALYKRLSKVFTEVLGIEPSSQTKNIYKSLQIG